MTVFDNIDGLEHLRASKSARLIEILSEPKVVVTKRGYQPVVVVQDVHEGKEYLLFISAQSLTEPMEEIRRANGKLSGAQLLIRKQSEEKSSRYVVSVL